MTPSQSCYNVHALPHAYLVALITNRHTRTLNHNRHNTYDKHLLDREDQADDAIHTIMFAKAGSRMTRWHVNTAEAT